MSPRNSPERVQLNIAARRLGKSLATANTALNSLAEAAGYKPKTERRGPHPTPVVVSARKRERRRVRDSRRANR